MLRVGEVGNRFSELLGLQNVLRRSSCCARANRKPTLHKLRMDRRYFVCVHKGGDNFSLPGTDSLNRSNEGVSRLFTVAESCQQHWFGGWTGGSAERSTTSTMLGRYPGMLLTRCVGTSVQRNMWLWDGMLASLSVCRDPTLSHEAKDVSIYHYVQPVLPEAPTAQECRAVHPPSTKLRVLRLCDSQK